MAALTAFDTRKQHIGRPRHTGEAPSPDAREQILQAAATLMAQQGYAGTTLREIADKVGIRAPSLYHYFRNKDEIALALSNSGIEESLARGHVIATGPEAPSERLHRWIWEVVHSLCDFPYDLSWMLDASLQPPWPESDEGQTEFWQEDILGLVSAGIDEGEFLPADPRLGLIAIVGLIQATISRLSRSVAGHVLAR